jgi:hypothetical protein
MNKLTNEAFSIKLKNLRGIEYIPLEPYINTKTKIKVKHSCGYEYDVSPNHLLSGKNCPKCGGGIRNKTTDIFKSEVKDLVAEEYIVLGEYTGVKDKTLLKHEKCGYEFEMRPGDFLSGQRCPKCAGKIKYTTETFRDYVELITSNNYTMISDYTSSSGKVTFLHKDCNKTFDMRPNDFQQGQRCSHCSLQGSSYSEKDVVAYIKTFYNGNIIENYRYSGKKEIDIYIPELNIGIEYDGLVWHSNRYKDKNYHIEKTKELNNMGIRLIHIFEDEWLYKKDIAKSKIKHILGSNDNMRVYAKNCDIKELTIEEKNIFLEKNHIQGKDNSSIRIGLYYQNRLVSVMTFARLRASLGNKKSDDGEYELVRFASGIELNVVGGFGKLLNYFKKNYEYKKIVTYADLRWSGDSNIYNKLGFEKKHESGPNYWYFNEKESQKIRQHRFNFRKQNLKAKFPEVYNEKLTEFDIMNLTSYLRIYDCGNLVYEMKKE